MLLTSGDIHKNVCPRGDLNSSRLGDIEVHPRSQGALSRVDSASPSLPDSIRRHPVTWSAVSREVSRNRSPPSGSHRSADKPQKRPARSWNLPTGPRSHWIGEIVEGSGAADHLAGEPWAMRPGLSVCLLAMNGLRGAGICSSMAAGLGTAQGQRSWKAKVTDSTHS